MSEHKTPIDPLRSGSIFRLQKAGSMSGAPRAAPVAKPVASTAVAAPASAPYDAEYSARVKARFGELYRATPIPMSILYDSVHARTPGSVMSGSLGSHRSTPLAAAVSAMGGVTAGDIMHPPGSISSISSAATDASTGAVPTNTFKGIHIPAKRISELFSPPMPRHRGHRESSGGEKLTRRESPLICRPADPKPGSLPITSDPPTIAVSSEGPRVKKRLKPEIVSMSPAVVQAASTTVSLPQKVSSFAAADNEPLVKTHRAAFQDSVRGEAAQSLHAPNSVWRSTTSPTAESAMQAKSQESADDNFIDEESIGEESIGDEDSFASESDGGNDTYRGRMDDFIIGDRVGDDLAYSPDKFKSPTEKNTPSNHIVVPDEQSFDNTEFETGNDEIVEETNSATTSTERPVMNAPESSSPPAKIQPARSRRFVMSSSLFSLPPPSGASASRTPDKATQGNATKPGKPEPSSITIGATIDGAKSKTIGTATATPSSKRESQLSPSLEKKRDAKKKKPTMPSSALAPGWRIVKLESLRDSRSSDSDSIDQEFKSPPKAKRAKKPNSKTEKKAKANPADTIHNSDPKDKVLISIAADMEISPEPNPAVVRTEQVTAKSASGITIKAKKANQKPAISIPGDMEISPVRVVDPAVVRTKQVTAKSASGITIKAKKANQELADFNSPPKRPSAAGIIQLGVDWAHEELTVLRDAHSNTSLTDPNFWMSVADFVNSWRKSVHENNLAMAAQEESKPKKRIRKSKKEKDVPSSAEVSSLVLRTADNCQDRWFQTFDQAYAGAKGKGSKKRKKSLDDTGGGVAGDAVEGQAKKRLTRAKIKEIVSNAVIGRPDDIFDVLPMGFVDGLDSMPDPSAQQRNNAAINYYKKRDDEAITLKTAEKPTVIVQKEPPSSGRSLRSRGSMSNNSSAASTVEKPIKMKALIYTPEELDVEKMSDDNEDSSYQLADRIAANSAVKARGYRQPRDDTDVEDVKRYLYSRPHSSGVLKGGGAQPDKFADWTASYANNLSKRKGASSSQVALPAAAAAGKGRKKSGGGGISAEASFHNKSDEAVMEALRDHKSSTGVGTTPSKGRGTWKPKPSGRVSAKIDAVTGRVTTVVNAGEDDSEEDIYLSDDEQED